MDETDGSDRDAGHCRPSGWTGPRPGDPAHRVLPGRHVVVLQTWLDTLPYNGVGLWGNFNLAPQQIGDKLGTNSLIYVDMYV